MTSPISKFKQPHQLLNHILDQPELPAIIERLDAGVLTKLIRHVGLEDSAQIVSLITTDQLKRIFDEDLWQSRAPGLAEVFDAERFGLWLTIMIETGPAVAAQKVLELDEDLVVLGLCRLIFVMDRFESNDDMIEEQPDSALNQEFDNYLVMSKNPSSWDAVCALLAELNEIDYEKLCHLLERCRLICQDDIEENNELFQVFTADESLEEYVAADREERRGLKGFVTPTSAAVFLSKARTTSLKALIAAKANDPVTRAYFKTAEAQIEPVSDGTTTGQSSENEDTVSLNLKVTQFIQTLKTAEVLPAADQKMLAYDGATSWDHHLPLAKAMQSINRSDSELYSRLLAELSYLSNTLMAGCEFKGRAFQPKEAAHSAFSICNLGSEVFLKTDTEPKENQPMDLMTALLKRHHLVKLFQAGWKILFNKVVLFTAMAVLDFLNRLKEEPGDPEHRWNITRMADTLSSCISSGRPWEFNEQMDYLLTIFDGQTTTALGQLVQAYPTMDDVICKQGEHPLSPHIWSKNHIRTIRHFLAKAL